MTGESGICTFNWFCLNVAHGVHIGSCVDRFFVGSCCKISENSRFSSEPTIGTFPPEQSIHSSYGANQTTKKDNKIESFSEVVNATIRPTSQQEGITPNNLKNDFNITNQSTLSHHDWNTRYDTDIPEKSSYMSVAAAINLSKTKEPSLNRKPMLPDIFLNYSPIGQENKDKLASSSLSYESSFSPETSGTKPTAITLFNGGSAAVSHSSNFTTLDLFSAFTGILNAENQNSKLPSTMSYDHPNTAIPSSSHIYYPYDAGSQNHSWINAEDNTNDGSTAFVLGNSTPTEDSKNNEHTDNSFTWPYSFLTDGHKNATNIIKPTSSAEAKENTTSSHSNILISSNPSQTQFTEMETNSENASKSEYFNMNEIDANITTNSSLHNPENSFNLDSIFLNFTKFTEPAYPWPSPRPSSTKDPDSATSEVVSRVCGRSRSNMMARIVGGRKSNYLRWPWMISLRRFEGNVLKHKCGATLLNQLWAITAAHCVEGIKPYELILRLGDFNFLRSDETHPHTERRIYKIVIHPEFDPTTYENDLALLRFFDPVRFRANIVPVCLPKFTEDIAGRMAVVTGWGRLSSVGELPESLHEVHMPILTNKECEEMYALAGYSEIIPDVFVCAGLVTGGLDACEGDSGGPMVVKGDKDQWTLVGLISWGMGCAAPKRPGVYTRITKFVNWIDEIIAN